MARIYIETENDKRVSVRRVVNRLEWFCLSNEPLSFFVREEGRERIAAAEVEIVQPALLDIGEHGWINE